MLNFNKLKFLKKLANLQLAIVLLILIGCMIAIGTIIEQEQSLNFYKENYSEVNLFGGLSMGTIITSLGLNRVYTTVWFIGVVFLFGSSLLACTFTTQWPLVKTFKLWKFVNSPKQYKNFKLKHDFKLGITNVIAYNCNDNKYHFFRQKNKNYAYSGLLGRIAPIVVHASIIILLIGSTFGNFTGYTAQELVPRGETFHIQNLTKFGEWNLIPQGFDFRVNNFWITYTPKLKIDQFYSDLSILNNKGNELERKILFVNEPLEINNLVLYQTDWNIIGIKLNLDGNKVFQIPLKRILKGENRLWLGSLSLVTETTNNLNIVINDLSNKIYIYDSKGELLQESNTGGFVITSQKLNFQIFDFITSTGLQIKFDPGISTVYFSFLLLIISIYVSFFSYSQIWFVEVLKAIKMGGSSNRAVLFFQENFKKVVKTSIKI